MKELNIREMVIGTDIDTDDEVCIRSKTHKSTELYINKSDSIKLIDHLTKVFDIKQEKT